MNREDRKKRGDKEGFFRGIYERFLYGKKKGELSLSESNPLSPKDVWRVIVGITPLVLMVVIIRCVVFSPFKIPSGSMIPTLLVGDHIVVSKFSYGLSRYSFFFGSKIEYFKGRKVQMYKPKRGDVIVFAYPANTSIDFVKRCVGLPGDEIQVKDGYLYVNGKKADLRKVKEKYSEHDGQEYISGDVYEETIPGDEKSPENKHLILMQNQFGSVEADNTPVYKVPVGHYFMMGDNRHGSSDSRFMDALGFVPEDMLIGPALFVFFSGDEGFGTLQPWTWPMHIRYWHLLDRVY
ncbi:signal peptidase I [Candidatus Hydrogenosomobacter endosymbioticus]|uniref:Signal peptidase I n=1 Tax=Candidatus Hydrogenosomobacter endosymbioticus TaxID=2558174 RepID=A0ABN6L6X4_9PROT|nr:signal peptidase I [Candidatus Hydrogenosomobacter endosymbioticus]BDB95927.1 signal peptidase I [Candidatus Hydrogenosomobacter endosymbioticus]